MSATASLGTRLARFSPPLGRQRPPRASRPLEGSPRPGARRRRRARLSESPTHRPKTCRATRADKEFTEQLARLERERRGRLRSLWQMTVPERIAAMRRGDLTVEQLAAWTARHPDQVPLVNGEFEWIAATTPEASE